MTASIKHALNEVAGQFVRLLNQTDSEGIPKKIRIHVAGMLEAPNDSAEWSVKINDTPSGASRIGFPEDKVESVFTQPSGTVEITLRG